MAPAVGEGRRRAKGSPFKQESISQLKRWYFVFICFLAYLSAAVDRHILGLLVEPMQHDLGITDTQFGLLAGAGFIVFYLVGSLPAGHLIDTRSRSVLLGWAVMIWSMATALTAFCTSIFQIAALRAIVGLGESMVAPATGSIVSDLFQKRLLAKAMSMVAFAASMGAGLVLIGGAGVFAAASGGSLNLPLIGQLAGWQAIFLVAGVPGLVLSLVIFLTMRDPPRQRLINAAAKPQAPVVDVGKLGGFSGKYHRLMLLILFGYGSYAFVNASLIVWLPTYFLRVHSLSLTQVGIALGLAHILIGLAAWFVNSNLIDQGFFRGETAVTLKLARMYALLGVGPALGLTLLEDLYLSALLCAFLIFLNTGYLTSSIALARLLPNEVRGKVMGLYLIGFQLIGGGGGPLTVGLLNDHIFPAQTGIGGSLGLICAFMLTAAFLFLSHSVDPYRAAVAEIDVLAGDDVNAAPNTRSR